MKERRTEGEKGKPALVCESRRVQMESSPAFTGQPVITSTSDLQDAILTAIQTAHAVYCSKEQSVCEIEQ